MAARAYQNNDLRRQVGSPKPKGRDHKDTLCRNILIYGHCRYENSGCTFNHDQNKGSATNSTNNTNSTTSNNATSEMSKKAFNVESPSFTPSGTSKKSTFTPQALSAAPFTPRGNSAGNASTPPIQQHKNNGDQAGFLNPAAVPEFTPQNFGLSATAASTPTGQDATLSYDAFAMSAVGQALPTTPYNPYADEHAAAAAAAMGAANPGFFPQNAFATHTPPLMHHLYFPSGPHKEDLLPFQRSSHDFFISEKLRQDLQKKSEAALQVINTGLPQLDNFHSLVALDTTNRKNANTFGYPSWVYKAVDGKTGFIRCLRRLEGFRLSNEHAIRSVKEWRRIDCGNVVSIFDAFTTRAFGDSSIVFVQEYYPLSKTLMEVHFPSPTTAAAHGSRFKPQQAMVPESTLWTYITQIANALKAIHAANLAARCVDLGKIILTDKNRVRLNACSILDVVQFDVRRPVQELQQEDLLQFGRTILSLASLTPPSLLTNSTAAMEHLGRHYSVELRDTVLWLLTPQHQQLKNIDEFVRGIATHIVSTLDQALHESDTLRSELTTSLENGRVARLMMKLAVVNERPEFGGDAEWAENGDRYTLKLFRDYVFHQVDAGGHPVVDLGHMVACLNKLDAGTEERVCLTSRDEQTVFVVSYRTLREQLRGVFAEVSRAAKGRGGL